MARWADWQPVHSVSAPGGSWRCPHGAGMKPMDAAQNVAFRLQFVRRRALRSLQPLACNARAPVVTGLAAFDVVKERPVRHALHLRRYGRRGPAHRACSASRAAQAATSEQALGNQEYAAPPSGFALCSPRSVSAPTLREVLHQTQDHPRCCCSLSSLTGGKSLTVMASPARR